MIGEFYDFTHCMSTDVYNPALVIMSRTAVALLLEHEFNQQDMDSIDFYSKVPVLLFFILFIDSKLYFVSRISVIT